MSTETDWLLAPPYWSVIARRSTVVSFCPRRDEQAVGEFHEGGEAGENGSA